MIWRKPLGSTASTVNRVGPNLSGVPQLDSISEKSSSAEKIQGGRRFRVIGGRVVDFLGRPIRPPVSDDSFAKDMEKKMSTLAFDLDSNGGFLFSFLFKLSNLYDSKETLVIALTIHEIRSDQKRKPADYRSALEFLSGFDSIDENYCHALLDCARSVIRLRIMRTSLKFQANYCIGVKTDFCSALPYSKNSNEDTPSYSVDYVRKKVRASDLPQKCGFANFPNCIIPVLVGPFKTYLEVFSD
jgi:hypothetical protein